MNAMNFPAAILQPPYFDPERPLAMDYGAIGGVIGHEISHSFDDQGAQFDAHGPPAQLVDARRTCEHFHASAVRLVEAVRRLPAVPRPGGERQADALGEHRRRGRPGRRVRRLPRVAGRPSGAGRRRACRATSSSS